MKKYLFLISLSFLFILSARATHNTFEYDFFVWKKFEVEGSDQYYNFQSDLIEDKTVKKELKNNKKTGLISYLLYENNQIIIDEFDPPISVERGNGYLTSNSVGKSLVSYVAGHAICEGYIESVDVILDDWSVLDNTLYKGQRFIDLLNMSAGDQNYIGQYKNRTDNLIPGTKINVNVFPIRAILTMNNFQGSKKSRNVYNYNALVTNIIMNYVIFKSGDNFDNLLHKVFNQKAKIKDKVYFHKSERSNDSSNSGGGWYQFHAKRYDYLRIAKAIMDDWNNDTCVGKYLKTINEKRVNKKFKEYKPKLVEGYSKSYGGQFHLNLVGMKKRNIFGLGGFGGQQILIDMDQKKIVQVHAEHFHYNWKKIVYNKIK
jgi:hypothetical protein